MEFKTKNNRYGCDVDDCENYVYAEMYRTSKHAWMYVCNKHFKLKLNKKGLPKERDIGFCVLCSDDKKVKKK